jgi:osmotically-inducible protein OsmY
LARRDDELRDTIDRLAHAAGYHWKIDVDAGVVRVSGPVDDAEARLARGLAGSVAGVVAIHVNRSAGAQA